MTNIEWTHVPGYRGETWNPVVGCTKVSAGCKHCYAETMHDRRHKAYLDGKLQNLPQYAQPFRKVQLMPDRLTQPLKWKEPRAIFVNSMSDLFHEDVPFIFLDKVFAVAALCPQHIFMILTKRPERMANYCIGNSDLTNGDYYTTRQTPRRFAVVRPTPVWEFRERYAPDGAMNITHCELPLPNVWLGTSVENQATADERIPHLLKTPAAVRFLSCEPLLGKLELSDVTKRSDAISQLGKKAMAGIDWVIAGGESGAGARPMHPAWARSLRDQCRIAGVPFFLKQWGRWAPWVGAISGTKNSRKYPGDLIDHYGARVRVLMPNGQRQEAMLWNTDDVAMCEWAGREKHDPTLDNVLHQEWPKVITDRCAQCQGKGWYHVDEWIGTLQGRKDCTCAAAGSTAKSATA